MPVAFSSPVAPATPVATPDATIAAIAAALQGDEPAALFVGGLMESLTKDATLWLETVFIWAHITVILVFLLIVLPFWTNFLVRTYAWMVLLNTEGPINKALVSIGLIDQPLPARGVAVEHVGRADQRGQPGRINEADLVQVGDQREILGRRFRIIGTTTGAASFTTARC